MTTTTLDTGEESSFPGPEDGGLFQQKLYQHEPEAQLPDGRHVPTDMLDVHHASLMNRKKTAVTWASEFRLPLWLASPFSRAW